jgi:hypothetical protein
MRHKSITILLHTKDGMALDVVFAWIMTDYELGASVAEQLIAGIASPFSNRWLYKKKKQKTEIQARERRSSASGGLKISMSKLRKIVKIQMSAVFPCKTLNFLPNNKFLCMKFSLSFLQQMPT